MSVAFSCECSGEASTVSPGPPLIPGCSALVSRCSSQVGPSPSLRQPLLRQDRPTCGGISPISIPRSIGKGAEYNSGHDSSVFHSHLTPGKPLDTNTCKVSPTKSIASSLSSSLQTIKESRLLRLVLVVWACLSPAIVGLILGLVSGWSHPASIALSTALFLSSALLCGALCCSSLAWSQLSSTIGSEYSTIPGQCSEAEQSGCEKPSYQRSDSQFQKV